MDVRNTHLYASSCRSHLRFVLKEEGGIQLMVVCI